MVRKAATDQFRYAASGTALAALLLCNGVARAAEEDFRIWENVTANVKLGVIAPGLDKWRLWIEGQGRFREDATAADQALARGGVGYQLDARTSLWLGYAHVWTFPRGAVTNHENRIWQQVLLTDKAWFGDWSSRTRLEQRFIDGVSPAEWRLREFVRFSAPIDGTPLSLVVWDEVFLRLNSTTPSARFGFDQNRAFAGFAYKFGEPMRVEIGYMNQLIQSRSVTRTSQRFNERMNHIFSVSMFLNL
ncbi:MAG: DUF2490 domain-containing protein [Methylocystis sp.]|nr:DUF2490 domain-containing protein [Methylocystis sp.]